MANAEQKEANRLKAKHFLKVAKITFQEFNNGAHLKIGRIDFWPGTGLWKDGTQEGRGVEGLIQYYNSKKSTDGITRSGCSSCPHCGGALNINLSITKQEK